jgi:hypothetical protein
MVGMRFFLRPGVLFQEMRLQILNMTNGQITTILDAFYSGTYGNGSGWIRTGCTPHTSCHLPLPQLNGPFRVVLDDAEPNRIRTRRERRLASPQVGLPRSGTA